MKQLRKTILGRLIEISVVNVKDALKIEALAGIIHDLLDVEKNYLIHQMEA